MKKSEIVLAVVALLGYTLVGGAVHLRLKQKQQK